MQGNGGLGSPSAPLPALDAAMAAKAQAAAAEGKVLRFVAAVADGKCTVGLQSVPKACGGGGRETMRRRANNGNWLCVHVYVHTNLPWTIVLRSKLAKLAPSFWLTTPWGAWPSRLHFLALARRPGAGYNPSSTTQSADAPQSTAMGALQGTDNIVEIHSGCYSTTPLVIQGAGAGTETTASGVSVGCFGRRGKGFRVRPFGLRTQGGGGNSCGPQNSAKFRKIPQNLLFREFEGAFSL